MSNYFDNQKSWSWTCDGKSVKVTTDHGDHIHNVDISRVSIGDMYDKCGQSMGDAHRDAEHEHK